MLSYITHTWPDDACDCLCDFCVLTGGDSKGMSDVRVENIKIFETFSNCNNFRLRCILRI